MWRISPTFLDSFGYYLSIEDDEQSKTARQELIDRLAGVKHEPNEAMQKGIDFENAVLAYWINEQVQPSSPYDECVKEVAEYIKGSISQVHVETEIAGGIVHGYIDFLRGNQIYDVKTCSSYDVGKYLGRNQHLVYLYALRNDNIRRFQYMITDFRNVYKEDYFYNPNIEKQLTANIREFLTYLENDKEMKDAFMEKNK